jgi:AcrR family transcriptional regulator
MTVSPARLREAAPARRVPRSRDAASPERGREVFNEPGVAAVGVREIARDLGLSPGNVSYHYPTKEALLLASLCDALRAGQ